MLTRKQIENLAKRFGVGLAVQERDYIQYIFLYLLNKKSKDFIFKCGTCLKVVYNSPRYSEDLDFNCNLDKKKIEEIVMKTSEDMTTYGIFTAIKEAKFLKQGFTCNLSFQGVRFNGRSMTKNKIRIDISMRKEEVIAEEKMIDPTNLYPDIPRFIVVSASLQDIFTEKIRSLMIRGKPRDLWDIWFLFETGEKPNMDLVKKKLELYNIEFNNKKLKENIEILQNHWQSDLLPLLAPAQSPNCETVKEKVINFFEKF